MVRRSLMILPLALLGACEQPQATATPKNDERPRQAALAADTNLLQPGRWETKTRIDWVDKAGLTAEARREILNQESALDQCLPDNEARRPDANFFAGGDGSECEYKRLAMQGGLVDAVMSCTATPGSIELAMTGTYTRTSYSLDATATTLGVPGAPLRTTAKLEGNWLGPCPDPASQRAPQAAAR